MTKTNKIKDVFNVIRDEMGLTFDVTSADELYTELSSGSDDFELDIDGQTLRFIHEDSIDDIQEQELADDEYVLGCFNDWFIADNTDLSLEIIQALQKGEQFEAIGRHIVDNGFLGDIQQAYCSADGYGHHFGRYDGNEYEAGEYYIFRTN